MATSVHFSSAELQCKHGINKCTQELVDSLEQMRALASQAMRRDTPVLINDAFRCPLCNAALPNAVSRSQHMLGTAADIRITGWTAAAIENLARRVPAINGIGRDDHKDYCHVDVRPDEAEWCYDVNGREIRYYAPPGSEGDKPAPGVPRGPKTSS